MEQVKFKVLDKGYIELQDIMGDDLAIVNAARVSFLGESKGEEKDKKLLFYLMKNRHTSPFEQVEIKMRVHAPVLVWWQWARHRTQSYNAQSGRYTPFEEDCFYVPKEWRLQSNDNKQGSDGVLNNPEARNLTNWLLAHYSNSFDLYKKALEMGVAKEQARLFLPGFALYYTWIVKSDLHNLLHFIKLRSDEHAQWEIRQYSDCIYQNIIKPNFPWTAEAFEEYIR